MTKQPPRLASLDSSRAGSLLDARLLGRHQLTAMSATFADFGTMIALVELFGCAPPLATIVSAIAGGVVNFSVSRAWAFRRRHRGTLPSQAVRYGAVSLGGALLNAALLALALAISDLPYPAARAIIAVAVSVLYTYPLHTRFVFRLPLTRHHRLEDVA